MRHLVTISSVLIALCAPAGAAEVSVLVPKDQGLSVIGPVARPGETRFGNYILRSKNEGRETRAERLKFDKSRDGSALEVHRRVDNGSTGSGVIYQVTVAMEDSPAQVITKFSVPDVPSKTYQDGLFGKFDVPVFLPSDALKAVGSGAVNYSFEIDSQFPVDSLRATFKRLADGVVPVGAQNIKFSYDVFPYRTGSKAVIKSVLSAPTPDATGLIDFKRQIEEFTGSLRKIAES